MDFLKNVLGQLLNPRSRLERLHRSEPRASTEAAGTDAASTDAAGSAAGDSLSLIPRRRLRARHVLLNFPLMIGTVLVVGLFLLAVFGPLWAPKNPYMASAHIVPHYDAQLGEYIQPPLPPSAEHPLGTDRWGNDLLSLMMHGARNTLVACAFITMVRIIVGLILGGIAGWNEGKTFDQGVMALVVVITAVPILISSMILIYALDIRKGLPVFIVALAAIGWAEIAQYIRSEFLILRRAPYIEGARATGLTGVATAVRHVLPNVLPYLLVITFLEMGAVMMLLGELSFIGVFIGGGSRIPIAADLNNFDTYIPVGIPDVPEWGAILAEGWRYVRSKSFVVLPPALAFFISVIAFNTMGEGLRRLVDQAGFSTGFLLRKRMVLVIAGLTLATVFIMNNTGPAPWYQRAADAFSGDLAYEHIETLTGMAGRASGTPGGDEAAAYIADRFEDYELEPGREPTGFVHYLETRIVRPLQQPYLALLDGDGRPLQEFRHQLDFGFVIDGHGGSGDVTAPLTFVGFELEADQYNWQSFKGLDLRDRVVVLMQGNAPPDFATEALIRGARGVLWITGDGRDDTRSQVQLANSDQRYLVEPNIPVYRIRPSVATALFAPSEVALTDLLLHDETIDQSGRGWFTKDQSTLVRMALQLGEAMEVEVPCVLGYKIGSDFDLANQVVIVFASYDGLGLDPDGTLYPAANHNASSVGLLLEIARLWQQQNLSARRSLVFVAWGGGQLDAPGAMEYLNERTNYPSPSTRGLPRDFAPAVVIQPDYVAAGGEELFIHPASDQRLSSLLEQTAAEAGITVVSEQETVLPYDQVVNSRRTDWLYFTWSDPDVPPDEDTLDRIEREKLQAIGEAFSLALTQLVRQTDY